MGFDPGLIESARREVLFAPYGFKTEMADRWAALLSVSRAHLYRLIESPLRERREAMPLKPKYYAWAHVIWQLKKTPPEEAGELTTEDAVTSALKKGLVPPEAADVPTGTYNRIARDLGWTRRQKRRNRIQAARPNQRHHFDASTSQFLHIARRLNDGEYVLKLHRPAAGGYKNKPVPVDRLRPYYYGLVDDHSGRLLSRCIAAVGENSADSMAFLCWAWEQMGLPEELYCDEGMLKKAFASRDWIDRLGVPLPPSIPYEKESHGKIERSWRTTWKNYELTFYAEVSDWHKFEITLTEFNRQLANFVESKYNQRPHRFERNISKMQAWNRINLHGGIVQIPENALSTVARREKRKVDVAGMLQYPGGPYEVIGLHEAWVWVFEGIFTDKLVVQDIQTGKKYEVKDFKPRDLGEFRAHPETEHEKLVKASASLPLSGQGLYADKAAANQKITAMPTRVKEEREIVDPMNVTAYASMAEAWAALPPIMDPAQRTQIEELVRAQGMDKSFVDDLAQELRAAIETQRRTAVNQ